MPENKSLQSLQTTLNRLQSRKSVLDHRLKRSTQSQRKARTRTLIQMGGLINMIGLAELCGVHEGEDLQLDIGAMDKAATLLGILMTAQENLPTHLSFSERNTYQRKGIRRMKMMRVKLWNRGRH